jgi:hypothetical protein
MPACPCYPCYAGETTSGTIGKQTQAMRRNILWLLRVLPTHLILQHLQALLTAAVMEPHTTPLSRADALLVAAVLVVAALAAVAHQEVTRRTLAAAATAAAAPGPAFLAAWLVEGPLADLAVDPAGQAIVCTMWDTACHKLTAGGIAGIG